MSRLAIGLGAVVALAVVVLGLTSARVVERGRFALDYSTYGAGPTGTMALFELLEGEGRTPTRWAEDLGRMPAGGMLVVLGGCDALASRAVSRAEHEALRHWVEAGGVLLVAGAGGVVDDVMGVELRARALRDCVPEPGLIAWARSLEESPDAGVLPPPVGPAGEAPLNKPDDWTPTDEELAELFAGAGDVTEEEAWVVPIAEPLEGMPHVSMEHAGVIDVAAWDRTRVLLVSDVAAGKTAGTVSSYGRGTVITLASASMFQNRDLADGGGAALFLRLVDRYAPDGAIRFDEYHVGAGERRSMMRYFGQLGVVPLILQALFAIGLVLVARGRRFGGVRELAPEPPNATAAFVHALAGLFRGSKDQPGALELLKKDAYVRIGRFHHATEREPDALAKVLDDRGRPKAAEAVRAIARVAAPPNGDMVAARAAEIDAALARALARE